MRLVFVSKARAVCVCVYVCIDVYVCLFVCVRRDDGVYSIVVWLLVVGCS